MSCHFLCQGLVNDPEIEPAPPVSPALAAGYLPLSHLKHAINTKWKILSSSGYTYVEVSRCSPVLRKGNTAHRVSDLAATFSNSVHSENKVSIKLKTGRSPGTEAW